MSRNAIARFFVLYFVVALAISVLWVLSKPGIADIRPAVIFGETLGGTLSLFLLPGLLPLIYWAVRRFRAESAHGVFATWGLLGAIFLVLSGIGGIYDGTLRPTLIPANVSAFFTNDYDTFVRVVRSNCVDSATKNQSISGLTDRQISAYCQCVADNLLNQLTVGELKTGLYARSGQTAAMQEKASQASIQCRRSTLGR